MVTVGIVETAGCERLHGIDSLCIRHGMSCSVMVVVVMAEQRGEGGTRREFSGCCEVVRNPGGEICCREADTPLPALPGDRGMQGFHRALRNLVRVIRRGGRWGSGGVQQGDRCPGLAGVVQAGGLLGQRPGGVE